MKKLGKFILYLFVATILAVVGFVAWRFTSNPETIYPFPYKKIKIDPAETAQAEKADIIILGDSAAVDFEPFMDIFKKETAKDLREPLNIYNWGRRGENLAHALAKVKSLKSLPTLFIYHGGLDELDRARFNPKYNRTILKNIEMAKNDEILSTIISLPLLSRLIYHPHPHVSLNQQSLPFPQDLTNQESLKSLEILYHLYQWEAQELTNHLRLQDAHLWFIPQAYNLMERPGRNCSGAANYEIGKTLESVEKLLDQSKSKEAISSLFKILELDRSHAETYYTLGKAFIAEGSYKKAKKAFYQSLILDCGMKRSNPLMLKILMEQMEAKDFKVFDFNRLVTSNLGRRLMFESLRTPQRIYYERLIKQMIKQFRTLMKAKN